MKVAAVVFASVVAIGWLAGQLLDPLKAVFASFRRCKLPDSYLRKIRRLLGERQNIFSWSYVFSPYFVWHQVANKRGSGVLLIEQYTNALSFWIMDIEEQIGKSSALLPAHVLSLRKSISATAASVDFVAREVDRGIQNLASEPGTVASLKREWNGAREHFNQWVREWDNLFNEMDQEFALGIGGHSTPIPPLE